ncbi:ATP-dependent DNA helicase PIF1-like protein [Tanacetum coccineum]
MSYPTTEYTMDGYNRLVHDELSYDKDKLKEEHKRLYVTLTEEQKGIYGTIMDSVDKNKGGMFFIYGYGGTGKTYLYKTMSAACHSQGRIVLNVASSGIAVLLLEVGTTTHSRNGKIGGKNDGEANVEFPDDMLIPNSNDHIGDEKTYNSSDAVGVADVDNNFNETMYTEEFLNNLNMAGIPHHSIKLKIAKIISGGSVGTIRAIPRMVICPFDTKLPFKLNRRQFLVQICFGMTINKSQGQTLSKVGLFLQRPIFSHGQLYVVVSRVKTKKGLKVLCCDRDGNYTNSTTNVVYKEALYRI